MLQNEMPAACWYDTESNSASAGSVVESVVEGSLYSACGLLIPEQQKIVPCCVVALHQCQAYT